MRVMICRGVSSTVIELPIRPAPHVTVVVSGWSAGAALVSSSAM